MTQARDLADGKFDTNTLVVDAANNRVGIGTTSPSVDLEIASTAGSIKLSDTDGSDKETIIKHSGGTFFLQARDGSSNAPIVFGGNGGGSFDEHLRVLSGGGLTFNGDTATANARDDYEEGGSVTTAVRSSSSNVLTAGASTYTLHNHSYTKIGRLVFVTIRLEDLRASKGTLTVDTHFNIALADRRMGSIFDTGEQIRSSVHGSTSNRVSLTGTGRYKYGFYMYEV